MQNHIAITAKGKPLTLPNDFSISIEESNPLFNDNELFSYPVQIPMAGNRFLLGNIDDPMSVGRPVDLEHTPMRIKVDGMPFRSGTLVTSEDEVIEDSLTMNISGSEHSLDDLIGNLSCRDIPVKDKILIGEKIGNIKATLKCNFTVELKFEGKKGDRMIEPSAAEESTVNFSPQALGFSFPGECLTVGSKEVAVKDKTVEYDDGKSVQKPKVKTSYINVSDAYPTMPYCNARIAYYHKGLDDDGKATSDTLNPATKHNGPENIWPYWVLDADRQQSGICFYVLYFLDCLFAHLGVTFDNSELLKVGDMRRLCFFTTHCKYDEEPKYPKKSPFFKNIDDINMWLASRGTGGQLELNGGGSMSVDNIDYTAKAGTPDYSTWPFGVLKEDKSIIAKVGQNGVASITVNSKEESRSVEGDIMLMYANSDNFPDESVSTILDSLWASFGIKFDYDYERKHVRAYFIRDVFRSTSDIINLPCTVIKSPKVAEKITGVRMKYSQESSRKEQQSNIKNKVKDYETKYDYIDYPEKLTVTDKTYKEIYRTPNQNGATANMNCYIDRQTGNAYRIKINSDATSVSEMKPVLFEVGQWKGVEIGDCSELNEDYVQEISSDFVPVDFSDVNYQNEIGAAAGTYKSDGQEITLNPNSQQTVLSAFTDEDMEHEFIEQRIRNAFSSAVSEYYLDQVLTLVENYDPSGTDDGNSPLQSIDWGLAVAVMRGGGSDATYQTYDFNYDGFGNSKWRTVSGQYALTADSIDMWSNEYDYNGTNAGITDGNDDERFSLKIRAWKQPDWAKEPLIVADEVDENGKVTKKIKSRGLFDTFMSEYAYFLLQRRKHKVTAVCSAAALADIPNHWNCRYRIGDLVGYINKVSYDLSVTDGVKDVEIELFVV